MRTLKSFIFRDSCFMSTINSECRSVCDEWIGSHRDQAEMVWTRPGEGQ